MASSEWKTDIREGYRTKTIRIGNCIVTVHRPILSDAERRKAEDCMKISMLNLVEAAEKSKKEKVS